MLQAQLLALELIRLSGPDQQQIEIRPSEIVSFRVPRKNEGHFAAGVRCLVFTTDGKMIAVVETCDAVDEQIRAAH